MKDVSCKVFGVYFKELRRKNIPAHRLIEGTRYPLAHFENKNERVEWDQYALFLKNARTIWTTDEEWNALGRRFVESPLIRSMMTVARLLFTARDFFRWMHTGNKGGQELIACIEPQYEERGDHVIITLLLRDDCPPNRETFLITQGAFSATPALFGYQGLAHVGLEMLPNGARLELDLPNRMSPLRRLIRFLTWPFAIRSLAVELKEANRLMAARYLELESAKQLVSQQATQLQTAYAVSQAVHADVDLSRTLETVADAFVTIARFAGAHVVVSGPPEREAWYGEFNGAPHLVRMLDAGGSRIGHISLWVANNADRAARADLLETVAPTVAMALYGARSYSELLDAQEHLEQRVKSRTAELVAAHDELNDTVGRLEAAEKARSQLIANVNHEIRTPLTLILLSVEEMQKDRARPTEEGRILSAMGRNARKLLRLVDGLLLLAARDENKLTISPSDVDVGALVTEVLDGFAASAKSCGVTLRSTAPAHLRAEVDDAAVDRILSNLVSNAIKFTPAGGEVVVALDEREDGFELAVSDTGVGISDEFIGRIFGRFEQGARPLRSGATGSGIGLSIVRDLAEAHCGEATVERLAIGTRFRIRLPRRAAPGIRRADGEAVRQRRSYPSDFGLPSGEHVALAPKQTSATSMVLFVEDDDDLRAYVVGILSAKHVVIEAPDAEKALELAETHRPDMLVSDVGLPGMDGLELTRRFRALPGNRLAPVLLLTAYASLDHRLSGFEAGAVDYLVKPFDPAELEARVAAQLDRRRVALQLHETEKLAAIGTMTAGLAHEMRNPANALVNAVDPLIELLPPELREPGSAVAELLSVVRDSSAQIGMLSRQLLGFRRGTEVAREKTDARSLIERSVAMLKPSLKDIELRIELRYAGPLWCAPALLMQVLGNLLENASHAVASQPSSAWISITSSRENDWVTFEIGDSGKGVPPALRERIFEPFFTTKDPGKGTGLGLSTSRQIAERHAGRLYVQPTSTGSVFRLELPLHAGESVGASALG